MSAIDGNGYDLESARPTPGTLAMSPKRIGEAVIVIVGTIFTWALLLLFVVGLTLEALVNAVVRMGRRRQ